MPHALPAAANLPSWRNRRVARAILGAMSPRTRAPQQPELPYPEWGGRRAGAGRKPTGPRAKQRHAPRPAFAARHPLHVTLRLRSGLPSLREPRAHAVLLAALVEGASRRGFRCVEYSVQSNHVHLLCEAADARALSSAMRSLTVRLAWRLKKLWRLRGEAFGDRYHVRALKTPSEVRNALAYVLGNAEHHGVRFRDGVDPYSSARWFRGSVRPGAGDAAAARSPLAAPRTWLLAVGWRKAGPVTIGAGRGR